MRDGSLSALEFKMSESCAGFSRAGKSDLELTSPTTYFRVYSASVGRVASSVGRCVRRRSAQHNNGHACAQRVGKCRADYDGPGCQSQIPNRQAAGPALQFYCRRCTPLCPVFYSEVQRAGLQQRSQIERRPPIANFTRGRVNPWQGHPQMARECSEDKSGPHGNGFPT